MLLLLSLLLLLPLILLLTNSQERMQSLRFGICSRGMTAKGRSLAPIPQPSHCLSLLMQEQG